MKFKVSKLKFFINEVLKQGFVVLIVDIILLLFVCLDNLSFFSNLLYSSIHIVLYIMLCIWLYKRGMYSEYVLYIDKGDITLTRRKENAFDKRQHRTIFKTETYNVSNLKSFKENSSEFVIYGEIQLEVFVLKSPFLGKERRITRMKNINNLKIRKNFENEEDIRNLLQEALLFHQMV